MQPASQAARQPGRQAARQPSWQPNQLGGGGPAANREGGRVVEARRSGIGATELPGSSLTGWSWLALGGPGWPRATLCGRRCVAQGGTVWPWMAGSGWFWLLAMAGSGWL